MTKKNELLIYNEIKKGILQRKLRPGNQLIEEDLAKMFGVSRTPIRNVLRRLSHEKLVKIIPNKGSYIYCPGIDESKQIFQIRKDLESCAIRLVCRNIEKKQIKELELVIKQEQQEEENNNLYEALDLSLTFHYKIAEITKNEYYYRYLNELISMVYVIVSFYGNPNTFSGWNEHFYLLDLIKDKNEDRASNFMDIHLDKVEQGICFDEKNIESIFDNYYL